MDEKALVLPRKKPGRSKFGAQARHSATLGKLLDARALWAAGRLAASVESSGPCANDDWPGSCAKSGPTLGSTAAGAVERTTADVHCTYLSIDVYAL